MANILNAKFIKIGESTYNVGWSKNNLSDELLAKLNGIAEGAQVNVIETVKMNGEAVAVTQKAVDLGNLQKKLTAGVGIALTEDGNISTTLDTDVFIVVESKPEAPAAGKENKIYLWPSAGEEGNNYSENIWVNGAWENVGTFKADVDLSSYAKKADVEAVDAKADKNKTDIAAANGKITELETSVGKTTDAAAADGSVYARIAAVKATADGNVTEIANVRKIAEANNNVTFEYVAESETLNITVA